MSKRHVHDKQMRVDTDGRIHIWLKSHPEPEHATIVDPAHDQIT